MDLSIHLEGVCVCKQTHVCVFVCVFITTTHAQWFGFRPFLLNNGYLTSHGNNWLYVIHIAHQTQCHITIN